MPRNPNVTRIPGSTQYDYSGTSRITINKNNIISEAKLLSEQANKMPDSTVIRGAKIDGKKFIYFRDTTGGGSATRLKNKSEISQNRKNIKKILDQIIDDFEKNRDGKVTKNERAALTKIKELTADVNAEITAGNIREPLREITKSDNYDPRAKIRKIYQSPTRSNTGNLIIMYGRFRAIDAIQKNNLKKILFPDLARISLDKQEHIINQMTELVQFQLKFSNNSLEENVNKCKDSEALKEFVSAWSSFREIEKNLPKGAPKQSVQFGWTSAIDLLCSDLKKSVFNEKNSIADVKNLPDGSVNQNAPATTNPELKSRSARKPKKMYTVGKRKIALDRVRNRSINTPILKNKKSPISQLSIAKNMMNGSPMASFFNSATKVIPGFIRHTESGELENEIVFFEKAATEAKVRSDLARQRLVAIYQARAVKINQINQYAMSGSRDNEQLSLRNFRDVRDAITEASSIPRISTTSPLESGLRPEALLYPNMRSQSINSIPMPLPFTDSSSLVEDSVLENISTPAQLNTTAREQSSTANNSQT